MNRVLKWTLISLAGLLVAVYVLFSIMAGGPRDAFKMARYALPYMHLGNLRVGDNAPDVTLVSLDGATRFQLRQHLTGRPLVVVFGSFT